LGLDPLALKRVQQARLRRVGVEEGLVVLVPVRLLDVEGVVLGVEGDLLDLALVDLLEELVIRRCLVTRAGADQALGEKRQHNDDQNRKSRAAKETFQVGPLLGSYAECANPDLSRGYQGMPSAPACFQATRRRTKGCGIAPHGRGRNRSRSGWESRSRHSESAGRPAG